MIYIFRCFVDEKSDRSVRPTPSFVYTVLQETVSSVPELRRTEFSRNFFTSVLPFFHGIRRNSTYGILNFSFSLEWYENKYLRESPTRFITPTFLHDTHQPRLLIETSTLTTVVYGFK